MGLFSRVCLSVALLVIVTVTGAKPGWAQPVALPNADFGQELQHWDTRTKTKSVYRVQTRPGDNSKYLQFDIRPTSPQRDRDGVYIIRRDLPTAEGYYRLKYRAKPMLETGRMGARIMASGENDAMLVRYLPGTEGNPMLTGQGDWKDYEYVFYVSPKTVTTSLQFEVNSAIGKVALDKIQIEKLDAGEGKKIMEGQQNVLVIPPFKAKADRTPQFPLKTKRMLFSDADIQLARQNIARYPEGKAVLDDILVLANPWLEWKDEDIRQLMTSAQVPRDFDLNPKGCPVHGNEVFSVGGTNPWILDLRHPFKVTCPVGKETYPSNDYQAYYESGFKEKKGWDTKYVDDGWGWIAPDGERYMFVAYANHWTWRAHLQPAILNLGRAYLLTGDKRYAHKAALMLYRLSEVYPSMNLEDQSFFAVQRKAAGNIYRGKVTTYIWETYFASSFAESYDTIWETIDGDDELQSLFGKDGQAIRSGIEANLLEEAMDAYNETKIQGNYGAHQSALLYVLLTRQNVDLPKYFAQLVDDPGKTRAHSGLRYTLYNQVWRDGNPLESPGYNWGGFTVNYANLSDLLQRGGYNLYDDPKLKLLFDWPLNLLAVGRYTPDIGDSGSVLGGIKGNSGPITQEVYQPAYEKFKDPRYLQWLAYLDLLGTAGMRRFDALFKPMLPVVKSTTDKRVLPPQASRLFAGYGLGMLNNKKDTIGLSLTYGFQVSHFHWDFLNFELFANGQKMMPDIGYPDAMNAQVKEVYTWSKNTASHNTVVVDEKRQQRNAPGVLHDFADSAFARTMDVSSPAYQQNTQYRRHMIMVDVGDNQSYFVDFFRVAGGKQHDYLLHGPPGEVTPVGGEWGAPAAGTFAGPNVEWGKIYDDPVMGTEKYRGSYGNYDGSGYQYFSSVRQLKSGQATLQYQHVQDKKAQLRVHLLPSQEQKIVMADAYDLPRKKSYLLKYLIARRQAVGDKPLSSTFVSVLEPYNSASFIKSNRLLALTSGDAVAVRVERTGGYDIVIGSNNNLKKALAPQRIETDASSVVLTFSSSNQLRRVFFSGGSYLHVGDRKFTAKPVKGKVTAVSPNQQSVTVELESAPGIPAAQIARSIGYFSNRYSKRAHPLAQATLQQNRLTLKTADALLVGRLRVVSVEPNTITTDAALPFSPTYNGTTLLTAKFKHVAGVESVDSGTLKLAEKPRTPLAVQDDAWLSNVGVGDHFEIQPVFSQVVK